MFLNLVHSSYSNNINLKVIYSSAYAVINCIHQLLLENILHRYHTFQSAVVTKRVSLIPKFLSLSTLMN